MSGSTNIGTRNSSKREIKAETKRNVVRKARWRKTNLFQGNENRDGNPITTAGDKWIPTIKVPMCLKGVRVKFIMQRVEEYFCPVFCLQFIPNSLFSNWEANDKLTEPIHDVSSGKLLRIGPPACENYSEKGNEFDAWFWQSSDNFPTHCEACPRHIILLTCLPACQSVRLSFLNCIVSIFLLLMCLREPFVDFTCL